MTETYEVVADICKRADNGESLKNMIYRLDKKKHEKNIPAIRALVDKTLRNRVAIDDLISKTTLSQKIRFNEVWISRVLVAELIYGKKSFSCANEITKKVYKYKAELKNKHGDAQNKEQPFIPRYCRINTLKCTKSEFHYNISPHYHLREVGDKSELTYEGFLKYVKQLQKTEYIQDYHISDLYIFHPKANLTTLELYQDNKIILQDKASCLVAPLLGPTPGSLMVDMCAAPGFKTQHLASISGSSGLILAVDINLSRYNILANTRINYELSNVMTFHTDAVHLPEMATKCIEYVMLDAPCSGSGVVSNYDYGTEGRNDKERLAHLHNLQALLLRTALTKYGSARRIVYSTCSQNEEENEAVIDELLHTAEENKFVLVNLKNHFQDFTTGLDKYKCGSKCIRLIPHQSCTNGFFIALFERSNPHNPSPRADFYKNINEIIAAIHNNKKRKAEELELENGNGEINDKENSVKDSTEKEINKKTKFSEDESDSSDDEDEKNVPSPQPEVNEMDNYIRVVRSPLLKNPVNSSKSSSSEDESSDDTSSDNSDKEGEEKEEEEESDVENKEKLDSNVKMKKLDTSEKSEDEDSSMQIHIQNASNWKLSPELKMSPEKTNNDGYNFDINYQNSNNNPRRYSSDGYNNQRNDYFNYNKGGNDFRGNRYNSRGSSREFSRGGGRGRNRGNFRGNRGRGNKSW